MHHALRGHENPALDIAIQFANQTGLPLLVYHAISEEYPFASDRHHTFMVQGARDVERELVDRGVRYVFHLQRENVRGAHLHELTRRAAIVVTEEMPLSPIMGWLDRLQSTSSGAIATVDCSCVVPSGLLKKPYTRAFEFRDAIKPFLKSYIERQYPRQDITCRPFAGTLPFTPLHLQDADLRTLISDCRIDHAVAPVIDTPGGSRAGYARWADYRTNGLPSYAARRNDAADHGGVSRMSAYLHYGMVSPFRIAREAAAAGAEKFIDELLIWRELAFNFCTHHHDIIDSLAAIPDWAQKTLAQHRNDSRQHDLSWESFARAQSGERLWDACQRSLLKHGELHNNLRMTWGKSILAWTESPARALQIAIDLNHRYALDGRDPSSYGGLLWCFGQFDRPFKPEQPIYGTVRTRSTAEHERRIDMKKLLRVADRPICNDSPTIAIIGTGLAGLMAARTLADHGLRVDVFEKSRGVGGRMSTRRTPGGLHFDHGAQYFTARDDRFARYVHSWIQDGLVQPWDGRIVELQNGSIIAEKTQTHRYVAVPGMNAIANCIATELQVTLNCTINSINAMDGATRPAWSLVDSDGRSHGPYDVVIVNAPPVQAAKLIDRHSPITQRIGTTEMMPCWTAMVELDGTPPDYDGAFVHHNPLSWISRNDSKPGRPASQNSCWVLHASSAWSQANLERDAAAVEAALHDAFCTATGLTKSRLISHGTHRWRYAIPARVLDTSCLWDRETGIGACGDWCNGPRIEGAFLSGTAMAGEVLRDLTIDRPFVKAREQTPMLFD